MRDKNGAQVSKLRAILCALKCPFFVPKVIHNLVALLMYSERYWLINALSAHNPLGSVKGTGGKPCSFSHYVFSPLPVVQRASFFLFFLLAKFKGQKPEYLPSNAFKRTLLLISVSSITLKSLTRNCSYISPLLILTHKEYAVHSHLL